MEELDKLDKLSAHQCVLLAAKYAAESNIHALRALTAARENDLEFGLVLRLLLTFLPETIEPAQYTPYLDELATGTRNPGDNVPTLDTTPIDALSAAEARRRARKLHMLLQPLPHPLYEVETELDSFTHFLVNRAHRIDAETGLLEFIPQLITPFLHHSEYIRTWFISTILPLLRLGYEYYPQVPAPSLEDFAQWTGKRAIETLLSNLRQTPGQGPDLREPARDLRGVVGPWICGATDRRRRIPDRQGQGVSTSTASQDPDDWECLFEWLAHISKQDFGLAASAFINWDGPDDLDLGGFDEGLEFVDEDRRAQLERRYAQAALTSLYLVDDGSLQTIKTAHLLLGRLSALLNLDPPADLDVSVESLAPYGSSSLITSESTTSILQEEQLLQPKNAVTQPDQNAIELLELFLFSAHVLAGFEHVISINEVARLYIRNDQAEQLSLLQRLLNTLGSGTKKDAEQWITIRSQLRWLWNWGSKSPASNRHGNGILGQIDGRVLETEILKAMLETGQYHLVIQTYLENPSAKKLLPQPEVENVVLATTLHFYDNASNGNRTRGGMKKASDIVAAFSSHFRASPLFQRMQCLLTATHAISFYSLTLQHGVPFQPVSLRVSADPLSLVRKVLAQNRSSFTHLDDMISIGQNLVVSMPSTLLDEKQDHRQMDPAAVEKKKHAAERRVIGMAIEAALEEDDFETAYSYVVNRLSPHSPSPATSPAASASSKRFSFGTISSDKEDDDAQDVAWRAALQAGRYQSSPISSSATWSGSANRPDLRRLEQRMELLSQALILAPPSRLEEVLAVWQQCETEMNTLLAQETAAEERFNDLADRKLPGAFTNETVAIQPRREVGRGAVEEAPMGLFDVARGAAAAFSKTAFPLRGPGERDPRPE